MDQDQTKRKQQVPLSFYGLKNYLGRPTSFTLQGSVGQGAQPAIASGGAGTVGATGKSGVNTGAGPSASVGVKGASPTGTSGSSSLIGDVGNALNAAQGAYSLTPPKSEKGQGVNPGEQGQEKAPLGSSGEGVMGNTSEDVLSGAGGVKPSNINPMDYTIGNKVGGEAASDIGSAAGKIASEGSQISEDIGLAERAGQLASRAGEAAVAGTEAALAPETLGLTLVPAAVSEALSFLPKTPHNMLDAALYAAVPWGALMDPSLVMNAIGALTHGNIVNNFEHMFGFGPPDKVGYPLQAWHQISSAVGKALPKKLSVPQGASPADSQLINHVNNLIDQISTYTVHDNDPNEVPQAFQGVQSPQAWQYATGSVSNFLNNKFNELAPLYNKAVELSMGSSPTLKAVEGVQERPTVEKKAPAPAPVEKPKVTSSNASTDQTLNSTFYKGRKKKETA